MKANRHQLLCKNLINLMIFLGSLVSGSFETLDAQNQFNCAVAGDPGAQYYTLPMGVGSQSNNVYVKVYLRVFQKDNGSGGLSLTQIEVVKTNLNEAFNPHGIYFIYDCMVDFIPNTFLYENGLKSQSAINGPNPSKDIYYPHSCAAGTYNINPDGINIVFVKNTNEALGIAGGIPSNYCVINENSYANSTVPHEVGHCLGLKHTYAGAAGNDKWFCNGLNVPDYYFDCEGDLILIPACAETVDGQNCDDCGDNICDTPADFTTFFCRPEDPNVYPTNNEPIKEVPPVKCANVDPSCYTQHDPPNSKFVYVVDPNCEFYEPDYENMMSLNYPTSDCRTHFTSGQGLVMQHFLETHPLLETVTRTQQQYLYSSDCNCTPEDIVLMGVHTYTGDQTINGNLILQAGADVKVTGILRFPSGYGINVECGARLHVEGGLLTVACEHNDWAGICVEGNSSIDQPSVQTMPLSHQAGIVVLTQGATLEYANTAVSTRRRNTGWDEPYWGGLVYAQNAIFRHCNRAAEFMKYRPYVGHENKSRFIDCEILGIGDYWPNSHGVTIWSTDGIHFLENNFEDLKRSALLVYDAYAEVYKDNVFENNTFGIRGIASAPFMGNMIIGKSSTGTQRNVFRNNQIHIAANGMQHPAKGKYIVANNEFFNGTGGVFLDGTNDYLIRKNSFHNQLISAPAYYCGSDLNRIVCNTIQGSNLGIVYLGNNPESEFLENTFIANTGNDVNIWGTLNTIGVIRSNQGVSGWPAENCFSTERTPIITSGPTEKFNYWLDWNNPVGSCKIPFCNLTYPCTNPNNYEVQITLKTGDSRCTGDEPGIPTGSNFYAIDSLYTYWQQAYFSDTSDTSALVQMNEFGSLRQEALFYHTGHYANAGQDSLLIHLLNQENSSYAQKLLYGYYLHIARYTDALAALNTLQLSTSTEDQLFASVQEINLAFYQDPANFTLDSTQIQLLWYAAESEYSDRAWARAMLTYHLGVDFFPEYISDPRSSGTYQKDEEEQRPAYWKVYPNPALEELKLRLIDGTLSGKVDVALMDILGRITFSQQSTASELRLPLTGVQSGIYILVIMQDGQSAEYHKVQIRK